MPHPCPLWSVRYPADGPFILSEAMSYSTARPKISPMGPWSTRSARLS